ncbi:MAG: 3'-5' exonuclease [Microthrixaceae bacterium]
MTRTPLTDIPPCYGLDIETDTTIDGLDSRCSAIVAVAVSTTDGDEVFLGEEEDLLLRTDSFLSLLAPGLIATWNGSSFDLPFIMERADRLGLSLGLNGTREPRRRRGSSRRIASGRPAQHAPERAAQYMVEMTAESVVGAAEVETTCRASSWWDHRHIDGYRLYRGDVARILGVSCGLKPLSKMLGLGPVEVDRSRIHDLDEIQMRAYVASDARLAREMVLRRMPAAMANVDPLP